MSLHLILIRPSAKYGSCTQFWIPLLRVVKLKSLQGNEKEDRLPPRNEWLCSATVHRALASDSCRCCSTHFRASRRGSQVITNQPWILLSPHCCWIFLKEWQILLTYFFEGVGAVGGLGQGSANERCTNRNVSPELLWAREEKQH